MMPIVVWTSQVDQGQRDRNAEIMASLPTRGKSFFGPVVAETDTGDKKEDEKPQPSPQARVDSVLGPVLKSAEGSYNNVKQDDQQPRPGEHLPAARKQEGEVDSRVVTQGDMRTTESGWFSTGSDPIANIGQ